MSDELIHLEGLMERARLERIERELSKACAQAVWNGLKIRRGAPRLKPAWPPPTRSLTKLAAREKATTCPMMAYYRFSQLMGGGFDDYEKVAQVLGMTAVETSGFLTGFDGDYYTFHPNTFHPNRHELSFRAFSELGQRLASRWVDGVCRRMK